MNRPTKLAGQFFPADRQTVTEHCFSKETHSRMLLFVSGNAWLYKQYSEKVQSRNILANALAEIRPSLAFSIL